ncbi:MAG: 5-(carboxyamino)imidazole ribonucleotide synthase [Thermoplasmataceae archaeon]
MSRIGIIGSGQLGWMMILEGRKLGDEFFVLGGDQQDPASRIADRHFAYSEYREFVDECDVVTYEFEHVDENALEYASEQKKLRPGIEPVKLKRDRSREKQFLQAAGFPIPRFAIAESPEELKRARKDFGRCVIKAVSGGYDGKEQYYLKEDQDLPEGMPEQKYVIEDYIDYEYEASIIVSRSTRGEISAHTPSYNLNMNGILINNLAPTEDKGMLDIARKLVYTLNYVGVMGIEFFVVAGKPIINEFAPRVHNSGHHTLVGSSISQFEQHLRAITGLPVGSPELLSPSGIVNIIGTGLDSIKRNSILKIGSTQIYWYGKNDIRRKRKMGHVNCVSSTENGLKTKLGQVMAVVYGNDLAKLI